MLEMTVIQSFLKQAQDADLSRMIAFFALKTFCNGLLMMLKFQAALAPDQFVDGQAHGRDAAEYRSRSSFVEVFQHGGVGPGR